MNKKMKMLITCGCFIVLSLFGAYAVQQSRNDATLTSLNQEVKTLTKERDALVSKINKTNQTAKAETIGYDLTRVDNDQAQLEKMYKDIFTWDTISEYNDVRDRLQSKYNVKEDSVVLVSYMPKLDDDIKKQFKEQGSNIKYRSHETSVISVNDKGVYSYVSQVRVANTTKKHSLVETYTMLVTVDIDADGNVQNLYIDGVSL